MGSGNPITYPLTLWVNGRYPMRSVGATIQQLRENNDEESMRRQLESWHAIPLGDGTILPGPHEVADRVSIGKYGIGIWSLNGFISETMDLKLKDGRLDQSIEVRRNGKLLHQEVLGKVTVR